MKTCELTGAALDWAVAKCALHPHAAHAIRAAVNYRVWGPHAAFAYCRNKGVPVRLMVLARQLQSVTKAGF